MVVAGDPADATVAGWLADAAALGRAAQLAGPHGLAPAMVAGYVPWLITRWDLRAPFLGLEPLRWFGAILRPPSIRAIARTLPRASGLGSTSTPLVAWMSCRIMSSVPPAPVR